MTPEEEGELARGFLQSSYWNQLLFPIIKEKLSILEEKTRIFIAEDAPKNKFSIITGEFNALSNIQKDLETLSKR